MVSQKITLSILLLATVGFDNHITALSDNAYAESFKGKNSDYRYLEFYFIEQPKNLLNEHITKARAILLAGITSAVLANSKFQLFNTQTDLVTSISTSMLALTGFDVYSAQKENEIKKNILIKFINNWEFHKQYIPTSLVPAFDELAAIFNGSENKTFSDEDVNSIFEVIQHLIEHEFSGRYAKEKKKDIDTLGLFKTITDIGKNLDIGKSSK